MSSIFILVLCLGVLFKLQLREWSLNRMQLGGGNGDLAGRYGRALWGKVLKKKLHKERTPEYA